MPSAKRTVGDASDGRVSGLVICEFDAPILHHVNPKCNVANIVWMCNLPIVLCDLRVLFRVRKNGTVTNCDCDCDRNMKTCIAKIQ